MTDPKFMTPPHRRAYLTHLNRCKVMDSYHRALIYALTAVPALRYNIDACFNFEKDEIKPESLAAGWQTSGTTKLTRFAYNLWNENKSNRLSYAKTRILLCRSESAHR